MHTLFKKIILVISSNLVTYNIVHCHTQHTHILFYGSLGFVQNNPGKPVPEETFTHSHLITVINHPLSASSIY